MTFYDNVYSTIFLYMLLSVTPTLETSTTAHICRYFNNGKMFDKGIGVLLHTYKEWHKQIKTKLQ